MNELIDYRKMKLPRPCSISTSGAYFDGCICWAITENGIALVEHPSGEISRYDLTTHYTLRFN
jgi:hypothetical protein